MVAEKLDFYPTFTVESRKTNSAIKQVLLFVGALFLTLGFGSLMLRIGPNPRILAWLLYICGVILILYQPRWGLYLIMFLGLVGDANLIPWFPFVKNFSSYESILYLSGAIIVSPLESYILLIFLAYFGKSAIRRKIKFYTGPLFFPALIFISFITIGLIYGLLTGGNFNIALWEVRPFFYLVALMILGSNLLEEKKHFRNIFVFIVLALSIEGIIGFTYFFTTLNGSIYGVDNITEHSAAIHINTIYIIILTVWLYRESLSWRLLPLISLPFIAVTYLVTQRRAAFVALAIAVVFLSLILFFTKKRIFWIISPILMILGTFYLGIFWNSTSVLGLPAQAIKSVVAPSSTSIADQSSNYYRYVENANTHFTIEQKPLTGVGFGNPFYIIIPLADISFFAWWNYFPHNAFIYLWVKAGVGAFVSMLYFFGLSIFTAGKEIIQSNDGEIRVYLIVAVIIVVMHLVFSYVDISWDTQSMILLGIAIGMINKVKSLTV